MATRKNLAAVPDPAPTDPPPPPKVKLTPFEGQDVIRVAIIVRKTGDGLSEGMAVAPVEYHVGDEFTMLVRCRVDKVRFDPVKDTDCLARVHDSSALEGTIVDDDTGEQYFEAQRKKIEEDKLRKEKEQGIERLPLGNPGGAILGPEADPFGDPAEDPLGDVDGNEPE